MSWRKLSASCWRSRGIRGRAARGSCRCARRSWSPPGTSGRTSSRKYGRRSSTWTRARYRNTLSSSRRYIEATEDFGLRRRRRRRPPGMRSPWSTARCGRAGPGKSTMSCGPGNTKTTGHGSLIITNLSGRVTYVSEPVPGKDHDMAKLKNSECEKILRAAGGVFGDKGFIGTGYITTPIRKPQCRKLLDWEHKWNNKVEFVSRPRRACCS